MLRVAIIFSQLRHEFTRLLYPNAVTPVTIDAAEIPNKIVFSVLSYAFIWLLSALTGVLLLLGSGMPPLESFSAAVASITNLGPGLCRTSRQLSSSFRSAAQHSFEPHVNWTT